MVDVLFNQLKTQSQASLLIYNMFDEMYTDCTQAASSAETQTDFSYCMSVPEMRLQIRLERLSLERFTGRKQVAF